MTDRRRAPVAAGLAAVVFACFAPVLRNGFVGYDDPDYVTANPHVNTGLTLPNVAWAFTSAHASNWHPLTWISHQLDAQMFGLWPAGHHLTSLLLHAINTALVFWWLSGATGFLWRSAFVAAVFGLHPLHVESVAWIAERKDVLSTFFGLLALVAYTRRWNLAVAVLFACSLMAKPMLVTLPLLLLVIDWWLEKPIAWLPKLPLFALSALSSVATLWAQRQGGSVVAIERLPLGLRLQNATLACVRYLQQTFWPSHLAAFYPFPLHGSLLVAAAVLIVITLLCLRRRWLAAGWAWYLIALVPVIGIVQVGLQSMADRYMYVPLIGLAIAVAWEFSSLRWAAIAPLAACAVVSWYQIPVWKNGITLWTHALAVTEDNFVAHDNLGVELDRAGRFGEALEHYRETLRIKPGDRNGEANFAQASFAQGERLFEANQLDAALSSFRDGLRYRSGNALAHAQMGRILTQQHQIAPAITELQTATRLDPTLAVAHMGLGVAYALSLNAGGAAREFGDAVRYDPSNLEANYNLGLVLAAMGRNAEARRSFDAALRIKPDFAPALEARNQLNQNGQRGR